MIVEPPLFDGAVNATDNELSLVLILTIDGAVAVVAGVPFASAEAAESPMKFTARTLNR